MNLFLVAVYAVHALVAWGNALFMRRLKSQSAPVADLAFLIPARNEANRIKDCIEPLCNQGAKVYVFDDGSDDGTAELAAHLGATVIRGSGNLPEGWTGKNNACHQLAKVALEDHAGEWMVFLDADTRPGPEFAGALAAELASAKAHVVSGFPSLLPGIGFEPAYMGWVVWIIGATNPFALVSRTGFGHNRFLNGQLICFKKSIYFDFWPHEAVRSEILDDVKMARWLAKNRISVSILNLSDQFSVQMYRNFGEALDGMSKNSADIAGPLGSPFLALLLLALAWGWAFAGSLWWLAFGLLILSKLGVDRLGRSPAWTALFVPISLTLGAYTIFRSLVWKLRKKTVWKGRTY